MGMRIEAFQSGKYVRPYYIFLNKPYTNGNEGVWRVHRHTVPPCIPLAALAAKHLPTPEKGPDGELLLAKKKQDLPKFMRALRTEIARYHARSSAISALRKQVSGDKSGSGIADVSPADAEAKMIRIEWMDGRVGRIVVDDRGRVKKAVVIAEEGRDGEMESLLLGGDARLEGLVERLVD